MTIEQIEQCDRCGEYFTALHGTHNCRPGVIAIPHKRQVLFEQNVNYSPENDRTRLYALQANVEDLISSIRIAEMHQGSDCCVDGLYCWKRLSTWIEVPKGIPHSGKGENSWDCGDDGIWATGCEGHDVDKAAEHFRQAVMSNRKKYGYASEEAVSAALAACGSPMGPLPGPTP